MQKLFKYIIFLFVMGTLYSCTEDEAIGPDVYDDPRDAYTGSWNCSENEIKRTKIAYTVIITKDPANNSGLLMENFAYVGMDEFIKGNVNNYSVTIPEQVPCDGWIVKGSGSFIAENELYWTYSVEAGGDIISYSATFTR